MLILDDDRLDGMRCSKCRKYLSAFPVKNHPTTHDVTCGRCSRYDDGGVRSFLYELVAVEYLFRCVNRYEGCGKLLRVDETEAHERLCVGGTFPCPKCEDGAEMRSALELMWHYKSEHPSSYLRRRNRFDARPQTDDVKLYVRDDVFAFISVRYTSDALHLAAATLTGVDVTQEFLVSRGEGLWERTERRACKAINSNDANCYILNMDRPVSVEVTFDLEACAGMYDVSVKGPSKGATADFDFWKKLRVPKIKNKLVASTSTPLTIPVAASTSTPLNLPVTASTSTPLNLPVTASTSTPLTLPVTASTSTSFTFPITASPSTRLTLPVTASTSTPLTLPVTASTSTPFTFPITASPSTRLTFPVTASTSTPLNLPVTSLTLTPLNFFITARLCPRLD